MSRLGPERAFMDDTGYFKWLVSLLGAQDYREICIIWDQIEFIPGCERDEDRIIDAFEMRERYQIGCRDGIAPSFLEVLVAMLVRYNDYVLTEPGDPSLVPEIFVDILENLDFLGYDDAIFNEEMGEKVWKFSCNFCKKSDFRVIFGVKKGVKSDFWTLCGWFLRDNFV